MKKKSLGHYVSMIYRHLQIHLNQEFSRFGFGSGQYLYFIHIAKHKGITQKELSRKLAIDKATTAKAVKKLQELGYIRSEQSRRDKRIFHLYLTLQGEKILPEIRAIMKGTTAVMGKKMSEKEMERTLNSLEIMYKNLTSHIEENRKKA